MLGEEDDGDHAKYGLQLFEVFGGLVELPTELVPEEKDFQD